MRLRKAQPMPDKEHAVGYWKQVDQVVTSRAANSSPSLTFKKGTSVEEIRATMKARQIKFQKEHA